MATEPNWPLETLWDEYCEVFDQFDDLSLGRWMAQTLSQLDGRIWRLSHPLLSAYRLAARVGHERQVWLKRLAQAPHSYPEASCCRAPLLPLVTRDVLSSGLICQHCNETAIPFDELDPQVQKALRGWADSYQPVHAVAHWDAKQQDSVEDYEDALEDAAVEAEALLRYLRKAVMPLLAESYPTIAWEDQDECLEVRPEDVNLNSDESDE